MFYVSFLTLKTGSPTTQWSTSSAKQSPSLTTMRRPKQSPNTNPNNSTWSARFFFKQQKNCLKKIMWLRKLQIVLEKLFFFDSYFFSTFFIIFVVCDSKKILLFVIFKKTSASSKNATRWERTNIRCWGRSKNCATKKA